jgi:hypothetical protein
VLSLAITVAVANMPGLRRRRGLATATRTRAMRRSSSSMGAMKEMRPSKVSEGREAVRKVTA